MEYKNECEKCGVQLVNIIACEKSKKKICRDCCLIHENGRKCTWWELCWPSHHD